MSLLLCTYSCKKQEKKTKVSFTLDDSTRVNRRRRQQKTTATRFPTRGDEGEYIYCDDFLKVSVRWSRSSQEVSM
ncbi:hypothetical protein P8452_66211 [Trifolium repens]|nr:hypothetical protein P8452_66211 [Trifolium repens]